MRVNICTYSCVNVSVTNTERPPAYVSRDRFATRVNCKIISCLVSAIGINAAHRRFERLEFFH